LIERGSVISGVMAWMFVRSTDTIIIYDEKACGQGA
jgi:hypothetical protein